MSKGNPASKRVIVHVGPHKTGSTAIQNWLGLQRKFLEENGISFVHSTKTHDVAKQMASEKYSEAVIGLKMLSAEIAENTFSTAILSQEDFSGDLPGRSRMRGIYPRIAKNLRIIKRSLAPHKVSFVFFERNEVDWLRSCYHQNLTFRTQFSSFADFSEYFGEGINWKSILQKAEDSLIGELIRVAYSPAPEHGILTILSIAGLRDPILPSIPRIANSSPPPDLVRDLERINALSSFPRTSWFAKRLLLTNWSPATDRSPSPPPVDRDPRSASLAFPELFKRVEQRFVTQDAEDLLPEEDVDLKPLAYKVLPMEVELPAVSRADMRDQSRLLSFHLRGKSELSKLNALLISYLRRNTQLTPRAAGLFHRVWRECGVLLINELSSRWLISTLQTFLDFGENEAQRSIGATGFFYANLIKIYEGERSIEGLEQDGILSGVEPRTAGRFRGLDRFRVGGTDLLLNTNALALEMSLRDSIAGIVLQEFLLRVKSSGNVFTRADATRQHFGVESEGFKDTWSFYVSPEPFRSKGDFGDI